MSAVLIFGLVLLVAVLVSGIAHRTVLSTTVVFLAAGAAFGSLGTGTISVTAQQPIVREFAVLALFSVLFTDALRLSIGDLTTAWRLPGRALLIGMPVTFGLLALLGHLLAGLTWGAALLLAAVLSPTDPVFAAAIVGREEIPSRLRHLLNVESGLNDGLALPVVVVLLASAGHDHVEYAHIGGEMLLGVALGVVIPMVAIAIERSPWLSATAEYEPLNAFAVGLVVLAAASLTGANEFLAAFAAGVTIATLSPLMRDSFERFGALVTELLKLGAVLIFGALVSSELLRQVSVGGYVFALSALLIARPVAIGLSLVRSSLDWRERAVASWFGPKGFASVVYGVLVLESNVPSASKVFALVAVVVAMSILAHSSTDVLVAHWFARRQDGNDD